MDHLKSDPTSVSKNGWFRKINAKMIDLSVNPKIGISFTQQPSSVVKMKSLHSYDRSLEVIDVTL